jgi:uncharacterized protein (DUF1800 family)
MNTRREQDIDHLFRRAGFGASQEEVEQFTRLGFTSFVSAAARLINYREIPDDVDSFIQRAGYVGVTARSGAGFQPVINILDARQRWLFRMVHTARPLQEKMALFWHNHFATALNKIQNDLGSSAIAVRTLSARADEGTGGVKGQLELFREHALGNFRDLLLAVARDPAMLVWLDGRLNTRARPQENFARELMELFSMGVGQFAETDVYAGARVFTGWNLNRIGTRDSNTEYVNFFYNAAQHETTAKEFTFPIYSDGGRVIPARSASEGMQDGIDLIDAVARHPATGPRLARKLYRYFINEVDPPDEGFIQGLARLYYTRNFEIEPMVRAILLSPEFRDPSNYYKRYSWPVEFVVRSIKEVGWNGFSLNSALDPLINMGQQLFEPPDVNGWELGPGWFSTGGMLARMNFASTLAANQRINLRDQVRGQVTSPESLLSYMVDRLTPSEFASDSYSALLDYTRAGPAWTGSDNQLATKASGLAHLIAGSGDYQLV